ncbi:hypothetical protein NS14008_17740 [Nocardia seriolae]|nr:hypothetical protein NS14008_17740 [Nocardia seriolae]PSK30392.1 hypothetical protein C6575_16110 [Nocardia seriolae]RLP30926.1 hypothetical protein D6158_15855 [Nocardia seriolae]BAW07331.1 conserved hypothetical protein [Nocardia seriolae]
MPAAVGPFWHSVGMRWAIVVVALLVLATGCAARTTDSPWRELSPPQRDARVLEFVRTADGVLALGSIPHGDARTPAAWASADGTRWQPLPVRGESPYAKLAELISAGTGDRTVVLGRAFGGAHSNPRMTIWSGDGRGLTEYPQAMEMFGGPHAIAVSAAAALGGTDLLIGDWDGPQGRYGAAFWTSGNGADWERHAEDPALSSAPGEQTGAAAVTTGPAGFVIVGETLRDNVLRPLEWTSSDGIAWQRHELAGSNAVAAQIGCGAVGCTVFGQSIGAEQHLLCWPSPDAEPVSGPAAAAVDTLQVVPTATRVLGLAVLDHTVRLQSVTANCTDWQSIPLPVGTAAARMVALPSGLLLATTDDDRSRLWLHALP